MGEEKFASLSSGLLARKGAAKPAMRRQGFINPQGDVTEDLGWNDMGFEAPRPINGDEEQHSDAPMPEVRKQQNQLEGDLNGATEEPFDAAVDQHLDYGDPMTETDGIKPYKPNGHGGLSPMEPSDVGDIADEGEVDDIHSAIEPEAETDSFHAEDADAEQADPIADQVAPHGDSPLSVKGAALVSAETDQQSESAKTPKSDDVPAREKVAFTLRLDKERHLKLRLASAVTNQSAQRLVTEALDRFLEEHPDVQSLVGQAASGKTH